MTKAHPRNLNETISQIADRVRKFRDRNLGEQNTKASLVEPMLESLGWNIRDPDEVHREYKPTPKDCPVDYALSLESKPRLFVEAKGLGETLSDRKWIAQVLGYATVAGVVWCVLTDGDEYRLYNAVAAVDAEEKLFFALRLSENIKEEDVKKLNLISRSNMEENLLDALWSAHFVDRRVKESLRRMLEGFDKGLIRLLRRQLPKLTPKEIVQSLRRLEVLIESSPARSEPRQVPLAGPVVKETIEKRKDAGRKTAASRRLFAQVTLLDLINAAVIAAPVTLFKKYKGQQLEATIRPDGKVEFQGKMYDSCSTAAEYARGTITGRRMNTNGWSFWQYRDAAGKKYLLDEARRKLLAMRV